MRVLSQDGLQYFWQKLSSCLSGKVDKVAGKGLSESDYTQAEKQKLSGIEAEANHYVLPVAGTAPGGIALPNLGVVAGTVLYTGEVQGGTRNEEGETAFAFALIDRDEIRLTLDDAVVGTGTAKAVQDGIRLVIGENVFLTVDGTTSVSIPGFTGQMCLERLDESYGCQADGTLFIEPASGTRSGLLSASDYTKLHALTTLTEQELRSICVVGGG